MSVHQKPDGRWFCKWREEGGEKRKFFGRGDIAEQQARRFDEEQKRKKGKLKSDTGITIEMLCQQYHLYHPVQESTSKSDFYRISAVIIPELGGFMADILTSQQLNEYVQKRLEAGKSRRTVGRELDLLKAAYNWGLMQEPPLVLRNPILNFKVPGARVSEVLAPPTGEEVAAILKYAPPHLIRAILIEWCLGIRPGGEVSRIRWYDVDLTSNKVKITSARKGGPVTRFVPIADPESNPIRNFFLKWKQEDGMALDEGRELGSIPVVHYDLKPVLSLKKSWKTAKKKAGIIRRMRLYDLRHAMATVVLENGGDLKALSEVLGHSRVDTTLRFYQHTTKDQHRQVVNKVPPIPGHLLVTFDGDQGGKR